MQQHLFSMLLRLAVKVMVTTQLSRSIAIDAPVPAIGLGTHQGPLDKARLRRSPRGQVALGASLPSTKEAGAMVDSFFLQVR